MVGLRKFLSTCVSSERMIEYEPANLRSLGLLYSSVGRGEFSVRVLFVLRAYKPQKWMPEP